MSENDTSHAWWNQENLEQLRQETEQLRQDTKQAQVDHYKWLARTLKLMNEG